MGFKAATRIKTGDAKDDVEYFERGDKVSKSDFDEKDWEDMLASESVVTDEVYKVVYPEAEELENQPSGTPSNLEQVEGTPLEAGNDKPAKK